jgi:hypothetical protein
MPQSAGVLALLPDAKQKFIRGIGLCENREGHTKLEGEIGGDGLEHQDCFEFRTSEAQ